MRNTTRSIIGIIILLFTVFLIIRFTAEDTTVDNKISVNNNALPAQNSQKTLERNEVLNTNTGIKPDTIPAKDLEVCEDLKKGDACTIVTVNGEKEGVCRLVEEVLVCVPDNTAKM